MPNSSDSCTEAASFTVSHFEYNRLALFLRSTYRTLKGRDGRGFQVISIHVFALDSMIVQAEWCFILWPRINVQIKHIFWVMDGIERFLLSVIR